MKHIKLFSILAGFILLTAPFFGGCAEKETAEMKVVTTTSLLEQIVDRIAGEKVEVVNIIPPAQCPGHFDVKPGDVQTLSDATLFLMHGWQGEKFTEELIASAANENLVSIQINASAGENQNWMSPPVQKDAVDKVAAALSQVDAANSAFYTERANAYKAEIDAKTADMQNQIADKNFSDIKVMCNDQLTGLVRWMGLDLVQTYGRPDSLTPQVLKDLVDTARAEGVVLFIDNLQAGVGAAAQLADEIDVDYVVFTNFPGGFDGTETWEKAIQYDIDLIVEVISKQ
jgi:zinc transport system substrate-binding protein